MPHTENSVLFTEIASLAREEIVKHSLPSLAIAVARDGEILWEEAFGWADRERRVPATPHTLYSLASISKPIAATGLMVLEQRGLVDLDRPVNDYLGASPLRARVGDAVDATVRRVANHTSGLPLHYQFFPVNETERRPPMSETLHRYGNLITAPGERYQYSNLGYGILDEIIARVSGQSFVEFMRREVFHPLGMIRASVDIGPGLELYAATRYAGDGTPLAFYDFDHPGASAVFSSAHDLVRFGMFHLQAHLPDQRAILSDERIDKMQVPTATIGETSGYGIGWGIGDEGPSCRRVSHNGGMAGVSTALDLFPSAGIAIVVLANASCEIAYQLPEKIAALLIPGYAEGREAHREKQRLERERLEQERLAEAGGGSGLPGKLAGEWSGIITTYAGDRKLALRVTEAGDVHARVGSHLWSLLNDARLEKGRLTGRMYGDIGTPDAARRPYHLHLDFQYRPGEGGDRLTGATIAISLASNRPGNALSHWTELSRTSG